MSQQITADNQNYIYPLWIVQLFIKLVPYTILVHFKNIIQIKNIEFMASIRDGCKQRLKVAFDSVRAVSNTLTFILIVDNYGLKVLSNTIKTMELINYGITLVERLQLKRKKINKLEAVYLINPESIDQVLDDYPQDGEPQYKSIHILALSKISPQIMQRMSQNLNYAKRVKTLKEINFNFSLHSNNQVKICSYDQNSFSKTFEKNNSILESTIDELTTIVTSMSSFYIVQVYYQKNSVTNFAQRVAYGLKERFEKLFKVYQKQSLQNYNSSAPVTIFLILDRSVDAVSPLVRDYHYMSLFYDLKDIKNHKINGVGPEKKSFSLVQNDQIMQKYKYAHFSAVLKGISNDFTSFSQNHAAIKFHKAKGQNQDVNMKDINQALKKMPEYVQLKERYQLHYDVLQTLLNIIESRQLKNQGFLQQSILSLTNQQGKKVKEKDIYTNLISTLQKTQNAQQRAKLVLIGLMCLQIKPKQQSILSQFLNKTIYKGIEKNINVIVGPQTYRLSSNRDNKNNQILDKHQPKIQQIIRGISNQDFSDLKQLRVGATQKSSKPAQKNQANLGLKKIKFDNQNKDRPRMIVFMNSAIGYNQIRCLTQFENTYQMIYASHNFVTQTQYLKLINQLNSDKQQEL